MNMGKCALLILCVTALSTTPMYARGANEAQSEDGGTIVLEVWDQFTDEAGGPAAEQLARMFEERYPNVVVERTAFGDAGELSDILRPALTSGTGPDVIYSEMGIGFLGNLARAGAIMDLTDVWRERGWDEILYPLSKDVPTFGGRTFGVGSQLEFVPIYYNAALLEDLGLAPPQTIAELEALAEAAKAAGLYPFAWGGRDWWAQSNLINAILWAYVGEEIAESGMFDGGSWDRREVVEAIEAFLRWHGAGYFLPNAEAIGYDEMHVEFYQQDAVMHPVGNWMIGQYSQNIGDRFPIRSMVWPVPAGRTPTAISFVGSGYIISADTSHPQAAIDYVDFLMTDPEAARVWYEVAEFIPPLRDGLPDDLNINPLLQETLDALGGSEVDVVAGLAMAAPPEVMTFLQSSAARLMTDQLTAREWVDEFERLWQESREQGLTKDTFTLSP